MDLMDEVDQSISNAVSDLEEQVGGLASALEDVGAELQDAFRAAEARRLNRVELTTDGAESVETNGGAERAKRLNGEAPLPAHARPTEPPPLGVDAPANQATAAAENVLAVVATEFDKDYYLSRYPDIGRGGTDPVRHYVESGWSEERDPNPNFSTRDYLAANPDVRDAGINPFFHYLTVGRAEGRRPAAPAGFRAPDAGCPPPVANWMKTFQALETLAERDTTALVAVPEDEPLHDVDSVHAIRFPAPFGPHEVQKALGDIGAIAHLEALRSQGATVFAVSPGRWKWFDDRLAFRRHLRETYHALHADAKTDCFFDLRTRRACGMRVLRDLVDVHELRSAGRDISVLDWASGLDLENQLDMHAVSSHPGSERLRFYDKSFDIVVVSGTGPSTVAEARRVATGGVVVAQKRSPYECVLSVDWSEEHDGQESVSIVIPTYNAASHLDVCLDSIHATLPVGLDVEVIIVDDGSTDETADVLSAWQALDARFRVIRTDSNQGFIMSCNEGARAAAGDLLVFLNNDTITLPGWLPPLARTFMDYPQAGAVGGKLIYPNGSLQEAGALIFDDATGAHFGRLQNPDDPLFGFVREVHYCSRALLATKRALFEELDGFDLELQPAYFEDTDYCFRVRQAGGAVLFQPESAIVHFEGASSGTDESHGVKRFQAVNREKFRKRWEQVLVHHGPPPSYYDKRTWERLAHEALATSDRLRT